MLVLAVVAVSWAAPLIRIAEGVHPLAISFWRTAIAAVVLTPVCLVRYRADFAALARRDIWIMLAAGAMLAAHFATWIASVNMTTVAASALLVASQPVFVALISGLAGEAVSRRAWLGVALAMAGAALISSGDAFGPGALSGADGSTAIKGDLLALSGAAAAAVYFIIGRRVRQRMEVLPYVTAVYGACALFLLVAMLIFRVPFGGYAAGDWWAIAAIAAGPQLIGHTTLNFLLLRIAAVKVAVVIMCEAIGSALIAAVLFDEVPGILIVPGGAALLVGIALTLTSRTQLRPT